MANALRHCAVWTSSVRRESVFNPRQFCANMCSRLNFLAPEDLGVAVSSGAQVTARVCETRCVWVACWRECRWEGRRRNDVALSGRVQTHHLADAVNMVAIKSGKKRQSGRHFVRAARPVSQRVRIYVQRSERARLCLQTCLPVLAPRRRPPSHLLQLRGGYTSARGVL